MEQRGKEKFIADYREGIFKTANILIEKGYHILPIMFGEKRPMFRGSGYNNSFISSEPLETIRREQCNLGISCDNILVLDIDYKPNKEGERGVESFPRILNELGLDIEIPRFINSPRGGYHCYFRMPPNFLRIKGKTDLIYKGVEMSIDARSFGNYVLVGGVFYWKDNNGEEQVGYYFPRDDFFYDKFPTTKELPIMPEKLLKLIPTETGKIEAKLKENKDKPDVQEMIRRLAQNTKKELAEMYGEEVIDSEYAPTGFQFDVPSAIKPKKPIEAPYSPIESDSEDGEEDDTIEEETPLESDYEDDDEDDDDEDSGEEKIEREEPLRDFSTISLDALHPNIRASIERANKHTALPPSSSMLAWLTGMGSQSSSRVWADRKYVPTTTHAFIIAQSGGGKSDLLGFIKEPIVNMQLQENESYKRKYEEYQKALKEYQKQSKKKTKNNSNTTPPKEPKKRYFCTTSGVSLQGVKKNLSTMYANKQKHGMLVIAEEGTVFFGTMNKWNGKGNTDDFSSWTILLDGESMFEDNVSSSYAFGRVGIGVLALIQDDILPEMLKRYSSLLKQGFFSRWDYDVVPRTIREEPYQVSRDEEPEENETSYEYKLEEKLRCYTDTIKLSDEAYEVYQSFAGEIDEIRNKYIYDKGILATFISSSAKHGMKRVCRMAGVIHLVNQCAVQLENDEIDDITKRKETDNYITKEEMQLAVDLFFYYRKKFLIYLRKEVGLYLQNDTRRNPYPDTMHRIAKKIYNYRDTYDKAPTVGKIRAYFREFREKEDEEQYLRVLDKMVEETYIEDYRKNKNKLILTQQGSTLGRR